MHQKTAKNRRVFDAIGLIGLTFLVIELVWLGPLSARAADPIKIKWFSFSPLVIPKDGSFGTKLQAMISGNPSAVQLALAAGGTVNLTDDGAGTWSVAVTPSQALFDYHADDANHNFVGFLDVFDGATRVFRGNMFVGVKDEQMPAVNIVDRGNDMRLSKYVVNIWRPDLPSIGTAGGFNTQLLSITQEFYKSFGDDYDFVGVVTTLPSFFENRYHFGTKNEVQGLGISLFNNDSQYSSTGTLQGITVFPNESFFDMAERGAIHELGHQWINFSTQAQLHPGSPHWPVSSLARGIMGLSIPGSGAGGDFPFMIVHKPDGSYVFQSAQQMDEYNDLELYMMGMLAREQVGQHLVPELQTQSVCDGCTVQGSVRTVTISDVIGADGPRVPGVDLSQKHFRVATIIVTRERLLTDDEMAFFDYFAARGEATSPLIYSSGFGRGTAKPFRLATRGVGTLFMSLVFNLPAPTLSTVTPFKKSKQLDHLPADAKTKKFHLELGGSGFDPGATVLLNGSEAETSLVSATQLSAKLVGGRIPGPGTMTVQVRNSNGSVSNVLTVLILSD